MNALLKDLRYGARMIRKTPGASLIAVIALALGIGLTTLMFSIVYGALIRGLPFEHSERLVNINRVRKDRGNVGIFAPDFADWSAQQRSFEELGAYAGTSITLSSGDAPRRVRGAYVSASLFRVLRVHPLMGRVFTDEDDRSGSPDMLIIGYDVWQSDFAGDPGIIGRSVRMNGIDAVIVGVMPRGFGFPDTQSAWVPLRLDPARTERGRGMSVGVVGRLRAAVSMAQATADMEAIAQRQASAYPVTNQDITVRLQTSQQARLGRDERTVLYTMLGAVLFVLLIACANVANLLIGRAMVRTREIGVRTALGAFETACDEPVPHGIAGAGHRRCRHRCGDRGGRHPRVQWRDCRRQSTVLAEDRAGHAVTALCQRRHGAGHAGGGLHSRRAGGHREHARHPEG